MSQLKKTCAIQDVDTYSLGPAQGARLALGARSIALGDTTAYFSGPTFRAATYSPSAKQVQVEFDGLRAGGAIDVRAEVGFELSASGSADPGKLV